jgi:hypothetical protein
MGIEGEVGIDRLGGWLFGRRAPTSIGRAAPRL